MRIGIVRIGGGPPDDGAAAPQPLPDSRWSDVELSTLKSVKGSDLEVVQMGTIQTR